MLHLYGLSMKMDPNSKKWSQKGYHSLPFAAKVSVRRSLIFKQSHSLNNWHESFPHHSILTVWNSRLRQQISKILTLYKVSLSLRWNDEGKQADKTKAECFKAWRLFVHSPRDLMHWISLRSLLRTYEWSTCSKSSIVFTDTKSATEKRTTPLYATCTSPIMYLICPPKFCISIIFNLSWDGCNIQEK